MKKTIIGALASIIFLGLSLVDFAQVPAWGQRSQSPLVRFTGTFYPPDAKDVQGGISTLKLTITKKDENKERITKEWIYSVQKAVNLNNPTETALQILNGIVPSRLNLRGSQETLSFLQNSEIAGKTITIQGLLYRRDRFMQVYNVEEVNAEPR